MGTSDGTSADPRTRAQASVLGTVLVLGIVVAGTAVVVLLGGAALTDTQSQSELQRAEHSMTLFDSRTAMVALGDSPVQTVSFGQGSGTYRSDPDSGWLRVTHANYSESGADEVFFNRSLGSVVYTNGRTEMAYQGGGVWRKDAGGSARMVSPPEFHYRGATLTLPIIRVQNDAVGAGGAQATIERVVESRRVFPNETAATPGVNEPGAPYNGTDRDYTNPVANGTVNVTVQSDYYEGWAEYFRTRTNGQVTVFDNQERVRVTLVSLAGSIGSFEMPAEGNSLEVQGMASGHPIDDYEVTLQADNPGGNPFNNMHWAFYSDEGNEQFEIHFAFGSGNCANGDLDMSVYYYNGSSNAREEWQAQGIDPDTNPDFDVDCSAGTITADLMGSTLLEYDDIDLTGSDNKWYFGPEISANDVASQTTSFDAHGADSGQYNEGETAELGFVVDHYAGLLSPQFDLTITDGPGGSSRIDEGASTGELSFDTATSAQYITFLHITENRVRVDFD
jgi:hypothetical protein